MENILEFKGLAQCCGQPDLVQGRSSLSCQSCGHEKGVIGGGAEFLFECWNQSLSTFDTVPCPEYRTKQVNFKSPLLNNGDGWRFAKIEIHLHEAWGESRVIHSFLGSIKANRPEDLWFVNKEGWGCIIDETRCLESVQIMDTKGEIYSLEAPKMKSSPMYFYIDRAWSTDSTWYYRLEIKTLNRKWANILAKKFKFEL